MSLRGKQPKQQSRFQRDQQTAQDAAAAAGFLAEGNKRPSYCAAFAVLDKTQKIIMLTLIAAKMNESRSARNVRGYSAVFMVSVIWVLASFIVKDLEKAASNGQCLSLTALFNALFLVYVPLEVWLYCFLDQDEDDDDDDAGERKKQMTLKKRRTYNRFQRRSTSFTENSNSNRCFMIVPPMFFLAQFFFNKSLQFVSVTVNTALSSIAPALTYVVSIQRGLEKPVRDSDKFLKALGFVALGVLLTAIADDDEQQTSFHDRNSRSSTTKSIPIQARFNKETFYGILLILASAICYAGYATEVEIALKQVRVDCSSTTTTTTTTTRGGGGNNGHRSSSRNRNNAVLLDEQITNDDGVDVELDTQEDADAADDSGDRAHIEVELEGATIAVEQQTRERKRIEQKSQLMAMKDSKSRQILASVGLFAFLIVLCTAKSSVESMQKSGFMIIVKGLIDNALAEYLWCVGVAELGASVASIGLLLQIPLSAIAELLFTHAEEEVWTQTKTGILFMFLGCALIVFGFVGAMKFAGSNDVDDDDDDDANDDDDSDNDLMLETSSTHSLL